jgi:predicted nucleotidyltransferase component of viral defense system
MGLMSKIDLINEAKSKGYRPEILEKVFLLLKLLEQYFSVSYLRERLVLKGGTALNLFVFDDLPRLSVDLDFNYIGSLDRTIMLRERLKVEDLIVKIAQQNKFMLYRHPSHHAGGKMVFIYDSILGHKGRLEIDMNYVFRVTLFGCEHRGNSIWPLKMSIPILDIHELAASKFHALLDRAASRDLFDSHKLLTTVDFDLRKLRLAFTVYAGMEAVKWRSIHVDKVDLDIDDILSKLVPVLKFSEIGNSSKKSVKEWSALLIEECKSKLSLVLPFTDNEAKFLEGLQMKGVIEPSLITDDKALQERITNHPSLNWRLKQLRL